MIRALTLCLWVQPSCGMQGSGAWHGHCRDLLLIREEMRSECSSAPAAQPHTAHTPETSLVMGTAMGWPQPTGTSRGTTEEQRGNRGLVLSLCCPNLYKSQTDGLGPPGIILLRGTWPSCSDSLSSVSWNRWKTETETLPSFPCFSSALGHLNFLHSHSFP